MTRNTLLRMGMALLVAGFLALLVGCGGDDDGLSAADMARIDAAEMAAADAAAAAAAAAASAEEAAMDDDDDMMQPEPDVYDPSDPGGTLEPDVRDRAAAQRIGLESADTSPIIVSGVVTGVSINGLKKSGAVSAAR